MKTPELKRCCFCCPLRWGIILFGYVNIIFSLLAVACLVMMTELQRASITNGSSLEVVTSTVLFCIFGMGVILNILLLVAGYQKDIKMLRLYNYYAVATSLTALVPTFILVSRLQYFEVCAALFAIVIQCYVVVLVRSEVVKLEQKREKTDEESPATNEAAVAIPDRDSLL